MKILSRILVATDFSPISDNVLENAMDMAKLFKSEIALVYVLPQDTGSDKVRDLLQNFAKKQLQTLNDKIREQGIMTLDPILSSGDFSEKIVEASEKINANIIFAGAGEKVEKDVVKLGSNAEKIIMKSNKPVFIVKNEASLDIKKILCPVDFSMESKRALKNAITFSHKFNAELIILNVYGANDLYHVRNQLKIEEHLEYLHQKSKKELDAFLEEFTLSGLKVTKELQQGKPANRILSSIKKHKADLLVMGTTGRSGISKILLGSVAQKVFQEIPSSFITLKKEDVISLELESKLRDIDYHYNTGKQLYEDGFYDESIVEYNKSLSINFMHMPSLQGLKEVYNKLGDTANENKYKSMIRQVLDSWHQEKIETDIRNFRS